MKDQMLRGTADAALESVFGAEYINLDSEGVALVIGDYLLAAKEDNCTVREYRENIGTGNLSAYVDCLKV